MRSNSIDGIIAAILRARSVSMTVGAPKERPSAARRVTAATTSGIRVAEDHRPPGADIVDEPAAVFGLDAGAARAPHEQGFAAHAAKGAHRAN